MHVPLPSDSIFQEAKVCRRKTHVDAADELVEMSQLLSADNNKGVAPRQG
jgi:hypothetical protein